MKRLATAHLLLVLVLFPAWGQGQDLLTKLKSSDANEVKQAFEDIRVNRVVPDSAQPIVETLADLAYDPAVSHSLRFGSAASLGYLSNRGIAAATSELAALLLSTDQGVLDSAAQSIAVIETASAPQLLPILKQRLPRRVRSRSDAHVVVAVVRYGWNPDLLRFVEEILRDPKVDPASQGALLFGLGDLPATYSNWVATRPTLPRAIARWLVPPGTRWTAARALRQLGPAALSARLDVTRLLAERDAPDRAELIGELATVINSMGPGADDCHAPFLAHWKRSGEGTEGFWLAFGLAHPDHPLVVQEVDARLVRTEDEHWQTALSSLARRKSPDAQILELLQLFEGRKADQHCEVLRQCARAKRRSRELHERYLRAASSTNTRLARAGVFGLGSAPPAERKRTRARLVQLVDDHADAMVRGAAIESLARLCGAAELPRLLAALDDHEIRVFAVCALGSLGPAARDALPTLERLRQGPYFAKYPEPLDWAIKQIRGNP